MLFSECSILNQIKISKKTMLPAWRSLQSNTPLAQVIFHLQTRDPPILPPICELFGMGPEEVFQRPLHKGRKLDESLLKAWRRSVEPLIWQHLQDFGLCDGGNRLHARPCRGRCTV